MSAPAEQLDLSDEPPEETGGHPPLLILTEAMIRLLPPGAIGQVVDSADPRARRHTTKIVSCLSDAALAAPYQRSRKD